MPRLFGGHRTELAAPALQAQRTSWVVPAPLAQLPPGPAMSTYRNVELVRVPQVEPAGGDGGGERQRSAASVFPGEATKMKKVSEEVLQAALGGASRSAPSAPLRRCCGPPRGLLCALCGSREGACAVHVAGAATARSGLISLLRTGSEPDRAVRRWQHAAFPERGRDSGAAQHARREPGGRHICGAHAHGVSHCSAREQATEAGRELAPHQAGPVQAARDGRDPVPGRPARRRASAGACHAVSGGRGADSVPRRAVRAAC